MLNRRKVLFGAAALMAAALPAMPVMASDSRLLADILAGVSDALTRDYIRRHYQEGRPGPRSRRSIRSIRSRSPGLRPAGILRRDRGTTTAGTKGAKTTGGATTGTAPAD